MYTYIYIYMYRDVFCLVVVMIHLPALESHLAHAESEYSRGGILTSRGKLPDIEFV